jgi:heparanase 1
MFHTNGKSNPHKFIMHLEDIVWSFILEFLFRKVIPCLFLYADNFQDSFRHGTSVQRLVYNEVVFNPHNVISDRSCPSSHWVLNFSSRFISGRGIARANKIQVGTRLLIDTVRTNLPAVAATVFQPKHPNFPAWHEPVEIHVSDQTVAEVRERFLSFTIDIAQVVGGKFWGSADQVDWVAGGSSPVDAYDFDRPRLRRLAQNLAPAYLRIGGTAADETYYQMASSCSTPPAPYHYTLTREGWDAVNRFAQEAGLGLVFTLNAGRGPRDSNDQWKPENACELMEYCVEKGYKVAAWGFGNEPNFFPFAHDLWLSIEQFTDEYASLKDALEQIMPGTQLLGPACAFWPVIGELLPVFPRFLERVGHLLDVVTWHYYPQQSRRSPFATRRASPTRMLSPIFLDETGRWATWVEGLRDNDAPQAEIWLEETGNAQCGGEPGLSDRFVAGFWWLDLLGCLARSGQKVIMRQNLSGADYSLINEVSLDPNPDYWNSILWKRLMGREVLDVQLSRQRPDLRVYAHRSGRARSEMITILAMNINREVSLDLEFDSSSLEVYRCTADDWMGKDVMLNGHTLMVLPDGFLPEIEPMIVPKSSLDLPPLSYAFVHFKLN